MEPGFITKAFWQLDRDMFWSLPLISRHRDDCLVWHFDSSDRNTVRSGYHLEMECNCDAKCSERPLDSSWWKTLWATQIPSLKLKFILGGLSMKLYQLGFTWSTEEFLFHPFALDATVLLKTHPMSYGLCPGTLRGLEKRLPFGSCSTFSRVVLSLIMFVSEVSLQQG